MSMMSITDAEMIGKSRIINTVSKKPSGAGKSDTPKNSKPKSTNARD